MTAASKEDTTWQFATIHLTKVDGSDRSIITGYGQQPMLSTDGTKLVYWDKDRQGVVLLDLVTWEYKNITQPNFSTSLAISPDGTKVSFWKRGDTYTWESNHTHMVEGMQHQTTWSAGARTRAGWSPDGHWLVYRGHDGIYKITAVGGTPIKLAADGVAPTWSVTGKIAFVKEGDIYLMNDDDSAPVRLTDHPASDYDPAWSPDGARILFVSERHGNAELYVMDADGDNLIRLTNTPEWEGWPSWSR